MTIQLAKIRGKMIRNNKQITIHLNFRICSTHSNLLNKYCFDAIQNENEFINEYLKLY